MSSPEIQKLQFKFAPVQTSMRVFGDQRTDAIWGEGHRIRKFCFRVSFCICILLILKHKDTIKKWLR